MCIIRLDLCEVYIWEWANFTDILLTNFANGWNDFQFWKIYLGTKYIDMIFFVFYETEVVIRLLSRDLVHGIHGGLRLDTVP